MEVVKVETKNIDGQVRIAHRFSNGTVIDALPVEGGFTHFDYVAMRANWGSGPILASEVYPTAEAAARAGGANRSRSVGDLRGVRGWYEEHDRAQRDDGPEGYGQ